MSDLIPNPQFPLFEETTVFLIRMCVAYQPKRILDAGSGMSSVLLRKYNPNAYVLSVDSNDIYFENSKELLRRFGFKNGELMPWTYFLRLYRETQMEPFDLVCHDLGDMTLRLQTLPQVVDKVTPTGAMLLDNLGISGYREFAIPYLLYHDFHPLYPAKPEELTLDFAGMFGAFIRLKGDVNDTKPS